MQKLCFIIMMVICSCSIVHAQSLSLSGTLNDNLDGSPLPDAAVSVAPTKDTTNLSGVLTDDNGKFQIDGLSKGTYVIKISYVGYETFVRYVKLDSLNKNIGSLKLKEESEMLKSVTVTAKADHVQQKNDTTEYNAETFKTNPDATAEDLLNKMPGISSANGTVTAHGETVQKVLVDGKEFFGDDATTAIKNLPAEVIDKVQVFDRLSDQSAFTGFDDGNSQKTINITTKKGRNNGVFGKLYAGYGYLTDSRYSAGGNVNWFDGDRRLSLIGMSNDINQQNFSSQDLLGVSGTGGRRGGGGGGSSSNFLVGNQGGVSTTHSVGLNYIDTWGKKKKVKVSASYFYNYTDNTTLTSLERQYYNNGTHYHEDDTSRSINQNHRINLRIEYAMDSFNSLIFTPKFSYQQNTQHYGLAGQTSSGDAIQSQTVTDQYTYNSGYSVSGDVLYQHKFPKRFRTFSIDLGTSINNKGGNGTQISNSYYFDTTSVDTVMLDQQSYTSSKSYAMTGSVSYTEPAGKTGMIQLNYSPSYTISKSDQEIDSIAPQLIDKPHLLDQSLSNKYNSNYMTQKAGISYRFKNDKVNAAVGVNGQYALLTGTNVFPYPYSIIKDFKSILPNAMLNFKFKNTSSLRIMYRTSTSPPSISQLQGVINNSNPLLLSTGNPNLNQSYTNSLTIRYGFAKGSKGQSFFAFANVTNTMNYVANATTIAASDSSANVNGVVTALRKGSQLSQSVNINGYWSANSFLTYGIAINPMKCNLNLNGGVNYTRTPGLINNVLNLSNAIAPTFGATLSSNISEKIDFTVSYSGTYNIVHNTLQTTVNNNYYTHTASAKFNWLFWKGFVFNTTLQNSLYQGVASGYNQDVFLWNAALGYKFLKDKSLEVRAGVNDILNQNTGISRTISQTYIEDDRTQVIKRYMLVTVTWTLRYFKKGAKAPDGFDTGDGTSKRGGRDFNGAPRGPGGPGGPPPGGPPPGGGGPGGD